MTDSLATNDFPSTCARRVLHQYYGIRSAISLVRADQSGFSGTYLWKVETESGHFALRSYEFLAERKERLQFAQKVICFVANHNPGLLSTPIPLQNSSDRLFVEDSRIWELSLWLPGKSDFDLAPNELKVQQAVRGLARFHEVSQKHSSDHGLSEGVGRRCVRLRQFDSISKQFSMAASNLSDAAIALKPAAARLVSVGRILAERLQRQAWAWEARIVPRLPVLADPWCNNLLFSGDQFVGFVDYSSMRMDTPAVDFVRMVGSLKLNQAVPWQQAIEYYREIRELESGDSEFIGWLHASGLVTAALNWLEWIFVHRREFARWSAVEERMVSIAQGLEELL